jgi:TolB-like protein/DNA-binding winged helix-turn-helix (wHTH) protein
MPGHGPDVAASLPLPDAEKEGNAVLASPEGLTFEDFRLDRRGGGLFRRDESGDFVPVPIGSRALDILAVLAARPGELVSKDEIVAAVWPGMIVEDSNLTVQISALRRVFDRDRPQRSVIQTVAGRGYRFVAPVHQAADDGCFDASAITPCPTSKFEEAVSSELAAPGLVGTGRRSRLWGLIPVFLIALAIVGAAAVVSWNYRWFRSAEPPRLSIVVLPFDNLSHDPGQQYFADGMTDDVTTDLSRLPGMIVISRNTAFTYRNKSVDTKEIGRELNVRYVLEGGVQRSGNQVRINAQLIDAETDSHLWAERFDRDMGDLFAPQNEITGRIAVALNLELIDREAARPTDNPDALDYILRERAVYLKPISRAIHAEAINLLERALAIDPGSVEAQSRLAWSLAGRVLSNMTDSAAADLARARGLSEQALAASPRYALAHLAKGDVLRALRRCAEAIPEYEAVLASDRNFVYAYFALGQCKMLTGSIEETIPLEERAIRLSPRDPGIGVWYQQIGLVHLLQSRTGEAILWLEKARNAIPAHPMIRGDLAAAYALDGEADRAAAELAEARRLGGDDRYSSIARLRAVRKYDLAAPEIRALYEATYLAGLRKAGMPEE